MANVPFFFCFVDSPALVQPYDGRGGQPQYYNQNREPAQFHDTSIERVSVDNSKYPTSDSRRHGRIHETGSNHASSLLLPLPPSQQKQNLAMAADQTEDCSMRYNKFQHDNKSTNLSTNVGRQTASAQPMSTSSSSFSGKNKEPDPYRSGMPTVMNDNLKSHISISALPKIPKIKNSATSLRLSKQHTERSHSPLVNLKGTSSPKFSSIAQSMQHDDNSMHAYDMQQNYNKRFPPNQQPPPPPPPPSILNGRNQDYGDNNSIVMDNNSNSSSINIIEPEMYVPFLMSYFFFSLCPFENEIKQKVNAHLIYFHAYHKI